MSKSAFELALEAMREEAIEHEMNRLRIRYAAMPATAQPDLDRAAGEGSGRETHVETVH